MSDSNRADPLLGMSRRARRRFLTALAGIISLATVAFWIATLPTSLEEDLRLVTMAGVLFVITGGLGLGLSYLGEVGLRRFAPLLPRVRDAGMPIGSGATFLLDNGMMVAFRGDTTSLTMFFGPDGTVVHPSLPEAVRWTGRPRSQYGRVVRLDRGELTFPQEMKVVLRLTGAGSSRGTLKESRIREEGGPQWIVNVTVSRCFQGVGMDQFAASLDEVASQLRGLLRYRPSSSAG